MDKKTIDVINMIMKNDNINYQDLQKLFFEVGYYILPTPYIEFCDKQITGFYVGTIRKQNGEIIYDDFDNFSKFDDALKFGCEFVFDYILKEINCKEKLL